MVNWVPGAGGAVQYHRLDDVKQETPAEQGRVECNGSDRCTLRFVGQRSLVPLNLPFKSYCPGSSLPLQLPSVQSFISHH